MSILMDAAVAAAVALIAVAAGAVIAGAAMLLALRLARRPFTSRATRTGPRHRANPYLSLADIQMNAPTVRIPIPRSNP